MSRPGSHLGLLDDLHASSCEGAEYSAMRPVVVPAGTSEEPTYMGMSNRGAEIEVVIMAWCSECGAADWEVV